MVAERWPDLSRTYRALQRHDEIERAMLSPKINDRQWALLNEELEQAARNVGLAYGRDTSDRNSVATCVEAIRPGPSVPAPGATESFVRRAVRLWINQCRRDEMKRAAARLGKSKLTKAPKRGASSRKESTQ